MRLARCLVAVDGRGAALSRSVPCDAVLGWIWRKLICNNPPPVSFFDKEEHVSASHADCLPTHIKGHVKVVSNDGRIAVDVNYGIDFLPAVNARGVRKTFPTCNTSGTTIETITVGSRNGNHVSVKKLGEVVWIAFCPRVIQGTNGSPDFLLFRIVKTDGHENSLYVIELCRGCCAPPRFYAFAIFTALTLNSGIFASGSTFAAVRTFADASAKWNGMNTSPFATLSVTRAFTFISPLREATFR